MARDDEHRSIDLEIEVPGTPEEVWRAIATGPTQIPAFGITVRTGSDGGTLGFHRRDQIIRPGRVLSVLDEARDASGALELGRPPEKGRFLIRGRTEEGLTAGAGTTASIRADGGRGRRRGADRDRPAGLGLDPPFRAPSHPRLIGGSRLTG